MQITYAIELAISGTSGNQNFQGRILIKWKLYDKISQIEKGKCPKTMTKVAIVKEEMSENMS